MTVLCRQFLTWKSNAGYIDSAKYALANFSECNGSIFSFLAHGDSYNSLACRFRLGTTTVAELVPDTCDVIYSTLQPTEMPDLSEEHWSEVAEGFAQRWKFPNCIGAVDGKHVIIQKPPRTNSEWYNYKGSYSMNLMAMVDHQYRFSYVNVGSYGSNADISVFRNSKFGRAIVNGTFQIPPPKNLPGTNVKLPHVIVADEAFPLHLNIMRPYPKIRNAIIPLEQMIYNFRQAHARRIVENAFGILVQRWRIFTRKICLHKRNARKVIKAACILHNFLQDDRSVEAIMAELCPDGEEVPPVAMQPFNRLRGYRSPGDAMEIRNAFKDYFNGVGALNWQENYVRQRQGLPLRQ